MNFRSLSLLMIIGVGCGFPLTPDAKPCGDHRGMELWIDSKGMTCEQARATIDAAVAIGDSHDFWVDKGVGFLQGMRLQFIGDQNLKVIGDENLLGLTVNSPFAHDMAVVYGNDQGTSYTYTTWDTMWPSAVTLSHEMIHVLQTDSFLNLGVLNTHTDKHCHWASVYAPRFSDLGWAQYSSNFDDRCEHERCSGSTCSPEQ